MIGWHKTEIAGLRQASLGTQSPTLSREPAVNEFDSEIQQDNMIVFVVSSRYVIGRPVRPPDFPLV